MTNQVVRIDFKQAKSTEMLKVEKSKNRSRTDNDELRGKRHLTPDEIDQICKLIRKSSRNPDRDELMVLMSFHHGYRVSELTNTKWQHIDLKTGQISVRRMKNGINTLQPISDKRELMILRKIHRSQNKPTSGFIFKNERGSPVTVNGFQKMFGKFSELSRNSFRRRGVGAVVPRDRLPSIKWILATISFPHCLVNKMAPFLAPLWSEGRFLREIRRAYPP